jgi:hypothetical protein
MSACPIHLRIDKANQYQPHIVRDPDGYRVEIIGP